MSKVDSMNLKNWLSDHTHVATSVFHAGRYCDDWKASTHHTGMPSFHIVLEGECWLTFLDQKIKIHLNEGDIVFFFFNLPFYLTSSPDLDLEKTPRKMMYSLSDSIENDTALLCGFLHAKSIEAKVLFTLLPEYLIVRKEMKSNKKINQIVQIMKSDESTDCELTLTRCTDLLLIYIIELIVDKHLVDIKLLAMSRNKIFARLLMDIMHNPSLDWTIEKMANEMNMSRSTFIRKIYEASTYSPNEVVARLRINIAINLLRRGYKAETLSKMIGYDSSAGFYKAFKKITNKTPAEFWEDLST